MPKEDVSSPDLKQGDKSQDGQTSDAAIPQDRAATARSQWQQEMPDLANQLDPMVFLGRLNEASHVVLNVKIAPLLKDAGLKIGEFDVLASLVRAGPPYKLMPTDLYKATMMSSGGMTARLDRLEKAGHITRCPHPEDRRALMVCLTDQGLNLIRTFIPGYVQAQNDLVSGLNSQELKTLSELLHKFLYSME